MQDRFAKKYGARWRQCAAAWLAGAAATAAVAQMTPPDIPFMAFYDHQGTYAATVGVGVAPAAARGHAVTAAEVLNAISPLGASGAVRAGGVPAASADARAWSRFRDDPQVTARVRRAVVDSMARQAPERRAELQAEFERADIVGTYRQMIVRHGYDPLDLSHNLAAFLILQWETFTGERAGQAQMRGAARQLERALRANGVAAPMSETERQTAADALAYQAVLGVEIARRLRQGGDEAALARLRAGIGRMQRTLGWDFERLALGADGFVPRAASPVDGNESRVQR